MKKNLVILLAFFFFGLNLSAQDKECGMEAHMHEMMKDPEFARQWEINQKNLKKLSEPELEMNLVQGLWTQL